MIDLHLHLDGSLSKREISHLAKINDIPYDESKVRLSVDETCLSLNDYLQCFDFPIKLLQNAKSLTYAAYSLYARLAKQGLIYAEVRFAPKLSTAKGLSQHKVVEAVIKGYLKAHQETGIYGGFVLCLMRDEDVKGNIETILTAKEFLGDGVLAIDLAGAEAIYHTNKFSLQFQIASLLEIPFTIHAGEADGPSSVRDALSFGAKRIGHGVHSQEDLELMKILSEKKIPLEICPTSEVDTHCIKEIKDLNLPLFLSYGIPITINTDDMTVSNVTLEGENDLVQKTFDFSDTQMIAFWKNSIEAAFCDEETKKILRKELEERVHE